MKVLFVINPKSGKGVEGNLEELIKNEATHSAFDYKIYKMKSGDEEKNIRKEIENYNPDRVACAGGDGTVNLMSRILANTDIILLIIPFGSANGMAKELGIGNNIENALKLLSNGKNRPIDLLEVNGHICIHLADIGLNARIVKRFSEDTTRGIVTYAKHLLGEVFLIKQYTCYLRCDNTEFRRKAVSLTFANASKYGTGAIINPTGILDDGLFELVIVKPFPRLKLLSISWKMFTGTLQTSEYVEVIRCKQASVRTSKKTTLQVDGEVIGKVNQININVLPLALNVLVPQRKSK